MSEQVSIIEPAKLGKRRGRPKQQQTPAATMVTTPRQTKVIRRTAENLNNLVRENTFLRNHIKFLGDQINTLVHNG